MLLRPASARFRLSPGYKPLAEQLARQRTSQGLSQKESARELGVDPGTLAKWEQGKRAPQGHFPGGRVKRFTQDGEEPCGRRAR